MTRRRAQRKPLPEPVELEISSLSHEGRGLARLDGMACFVDGALPGETVRARFVEKKRQQASLAIESLLSAPSPERQEPPCAHAAVCGGCSLQHLQSAAQRGHKQQVVLDMLAHFGGVQPDEVVPPLFAETLGYRTKARLGVRYVTRRDAVLVGFRERFSHFITATQRCPVLVPAVGENLEVIAECLRGLSLFDQIAQIEVAFGDDDGALIFRHLRPLPAADRDALVALGRRLGVAVYGQSAGPDSVQPLDPQREATLRFSLDDGTTLVFQPTDFTQVNLPVNRQMVRQAIDWMAPRESEHIVDLFCGLGNFSLPLARLCQHLTGVEGSDDLVARAGENAARNQLDNARFFSADLFTALEAEQGPPAWCQPCDGLLLDPPRAGAESICRQIHKFAPSRVVYVSCNPATLGRDAGLLAARQYRLTRLGIMDMFPHTTHVESMALFERQA